MDSDTKSKFVLPSALVGQLYTPERAAKKVQRISLEGKVGSRVDPLKYRGNGHWKADISMGTSKAIGFIYVIRNLEIGRFYIGKKFYRSEGKLTKGQTSNWAWYTSSCKDLVHDTKMQEKQGFDFIFIEEYVSRGALSWAETWSLCTYKIPERTDVFYNSLINKVSWKVREGVTPKHVDRIARALRGESFG